jgi:phospholipid-translocating ATPase
MITGDRSDTAVNIGASCNLIRPDLDRLCKLLNCSDSNSVALVMSQESGGSSEKGGSFVVVVDGTSLQVVLAEDVLLRRFLELCCLARSVVCCRVSPKQKGEVHKQKQQYTSLFFF